MVDNVENILLLELLGPCLVHVVIYKSILHSSQWSHMVSRAVRQVRHPSLLGPRSDRHFANKLPYSVVGGGVGGRARERERETL